MSYLLNHPVFGSKFDVNKDVNGVTPLMWAVVEGHEGTLEILCKLRTKCRNIRTKR